MAMSMSIGIPVKRTRCQTGATYCPKQHNFTDIFLSFLAVQDSSIGDLVTH